MEISILTKKRKKILFTLSKEELILGRIAEKNADIAPSHVQESLQILISKGFVQKDKNKVYSLTGKGREMVSFLKEFDKKARVNSAAKR